MNEVIYKYDVPVDDAPHDVGYYPVHAACQTDDYETVQVWSIVNPESPRTMKVQVFGTGQPIPKGAEFLHTILAANGALVWHLFDVSRVDLNG